MHKRILLAIVTVFGLGASGLFGGEYGYHVTDWGFAQHKGNRPEQQDAAAVARFTVNNVNYSLFMVADGLGGSDVSRYVTNNMPDIIQDELKENKPIQALHNSFKKCENDILRYQEEKLAKNAKEILSGTTVTLFLSDGTREYVANLGDSRTSLFNKETGEELYSTVDHAIETRHFLEGGRKVVENKESKFVVDHGGYIFETQQQCGPAVLGRKETAIEVPRALGVAHMKQFRAEDGIRGPINSTPDIYELTEGKPQDRIVALFSDGVTKHIDSTDDKDSCSLQTCWKDIFDMEMSDDVFYKKYEYRHFGDNELFSLSVANDDMHGNDILKKAAARMIYVLKIISRCASFSSDNVTVLLYHIAAPAMIRFSFPQKATTATATTPSTTTTTETNKTSFDKQPSGPSTKLDTTEKSGTTSWRTMAGRGALVFGILSILYYFTFIKNK